MENSIPKIIHWCWFGNSNLSALANKCLESWKRVLQNYEIILWNESNFDVYSDPYLKRAYQKKKFAFVSDYARFQILSDHGGIYLDVDVEMVKPFDDLLGRDFFIGKESPDMINAAIIGAVKNHWLIQILKQKVLESLKGIYYDSVPIVITPVIQKLAPQLVLDREYFYPYKPSDDKRGFMYGDVLQNTYCIHHWQYSWREGLIEKVLSRSYQLLRNSFSQ